MGHVHWGVVLSSLVLAGSLCQLAAADTNVKYEMVELGDFDVQLLQMEVRPTIGTYAPATLHVQFARASIRPNRSSNGSGMIHEYDAFKLLVPTPPKYNITHLNHLRKIHNVHSHVTSSHFSMFAGVVASMASMLLLGIDDVIWLLPFFIGPEKWRNTCGYLLFMQVVVLLSWLTKLLMGTLEGEHPDWTIKKDLGIITTAVLALASGCLFFDWMRQTRSTEHDSGSGSSTDAFAKPSAQNTDEAATFGQGDCGQLSTPACNEGIAIAEQSIGRKPAGLWWLLALCTVASTDCYLVFAYMLFTEPLDVAELSLGVFLGSCAIAALTHLALSFSAVVRLVSHMPLWAIFVMLTVWSLKGVLVDNIAE